ncbi:hypothetical protein [Rhodococcus erythropolis]|uniref:hypothetical protein n=1 Tax=Rhodococcus erythropolis TaxID=1833 RepID=UPI001BE51587|nr:hypothetical protein [Rhodococcus erythropolis]MBT2269649.1 hypothetical protein [Rhodococcus erythropolis]
MKLPELVVAWSLAMALTITLCVALFDEWKTVLIAVIAVAVGLLILFELTFSGYRGPETLVLCAFLVFWVFGFCDYFTSTVQTYLITLGIVCTCIAAFCRIGSFVYFRTMLRREQDRSEKTDL